MMLPDVDFCGVRVTRLVLGANPFGGFSHQNPKRDKEMRSYHTVERIWETWARAETAGINTMITNNTTPHVIQAVKGYLSGGGTLQWIAQVADREHPDLRQAMDEVVSIGCKALYIHGAFVDEAYQRRDEAALRGWCAHARSLGVPVGVAGHDPDAHSWVNGFDLVDFHAVCFYNCGSVHAGKGERFCLGDVFRATEVIQSIRKPCIGYKILGAGRIEACMGFEYAFSRIKPGDVVNVGMHRGDKDGMVEENAQIVRNLLNSGTGS
ncbi:MAG: hypothetical protein U1E27_07165 [Kiritimatiellia bacterium]|nr:hypothetical protein [Kiritimatiellia bacterium]